MKQAVPAFITLSLIFALRPGCGPFKPKKETPSEKHEMPEWCHKPSMNCYNGCFKRNEESICTSCCFEQISLCDEGKPYDFAKCDTVERGAKGR